MKSFKEIMTEKFELYVDDDNSTWSIDNSSSVTKAQKQGNMLMGIGGVNKPKNIQWEILSLNDFDKDYVKDAILKSGEQIFRITTPLGVTTPLVKLNIKKGILYFLTDKATTEDVVEFEKKGKKLEYLRVLKSLKF